jgi:hypothetical protein
MNVYGRIAYEAYAEAVDWQSARGEHLNPWDVLPQRIKDAWILSALAVHTKTLEAEKETDQ